MSEDQDTFDTIQELSFDQVARWLGICDDTRRELWAKMNLRTEDKPTWPILWRIVGLSPHQPPELHRELKRPLWETKEVARYISKEPKTVAGWCRSGSYPLGFPPPALIVGPRKKLWLPLEVEAYRHGAHFSRLAKTISRARRSGQTVPKAPRELTVNLDPLEE